jgi:AcrR family transcriptional regulator
MIVLVHPDLVSDGIRLSEPVAVPLLEPTTPAPVIDAPPSTRDGLVRAALDLFVERGYDSTSVSDLSVRAGVTTEAFYSQFSSKDEILRHLDNHFLDRILASTEGISGEGVSASEALTKMFAETIGPAGDHQAERMVFLNEFRFFEPESFPDVRQKSVQFLNRFVAALEKGRQAGEFRSVAAPRPVAAGLVGMCSFPFQWVGREGLIDLGRPGSMPGLPSGDDRRRRALIDCDVAGGTGVGGDRWATRRRFAHWAWVGRCARSANDFRS